MIYDLLPQRQNTIIYAVNPQNKTVITYDKTGAQTAYYATIFSRLTAEQNNGFYQQDISFNGYSLQKIRFFGKPNEKYFGAVEFYSNQAFIGICAAAQ